MRHCSDRFEEICKLIKNYDSDDVIIQTMRLKEISKFFAKNVTDEKILSDLFDFLNTKALQDDDSFITKFVSVVSSRQLETFIINGKIVRHAMLEILQKNFQSADHFKRDDINKFYNSIKLLGEYFNRARISNGSPINIIGQSLLNLLNVELEKELKNLLHFKTDEFSEIILTQFALNGSLLKTRHKKEIELVLINVRKCLIEINSLSSKTKAFLIMTLDLYYANFNESQIENQLDKIYKSYLLENSNEAKTTTTSTVTNSTNKKSPPPPLRTSSQTSRNEAKVVVRTQSSSKLHQSYAPPLSRSLSSGRSAYDKKSEKNIPKSPLKTNPTPLSRPIQGRRSEPIARSVTPTSNNCQQQQQKFTSPTQKKISPRELKIRQSSKTSPKPENQSSSYSPKSLFKRQQHETPSTTTVQASINDENVLKQQNSNNGNTKSSRGTNSKVYFKEENVENLSWNGETSFEFDDPELATGDVSPKPNQYSSSFLNFLSNN
ncbi:hypothetical protein PVAND_007840 [Polypedilum vanderplanki]|uniref:Uncharacterized protein n=1 Tax=Polypedilum vanderplanki TaxID=319348 RepID=A0A9J6C7V2_POLVA|nr:hypothetical protein PVAND_007840 [Polypedilum vanderplanki]